MALQELQPLHTSSPYIIMSLRASGTKGTLNSSLRRTARRRSHCALDEHGLRGIALRTYARTKDALCRVDL